MKQKKLLTRKQIKEEIINILGYDLIVKINKSGNTSYFFKDYDNKDKTNLNDGFIKLWTDLIDWYSNWISINCYDLVEEKFPNITYSEYKKIEKAIDFLMDNITEPKTWYIRRWFLKYIEEDLYFFSINLD